MKQVNRPVRVAAVMPQRCSDVVVAGQAEDANDGVADRGHHLRTVTGPDGGAVLVERDIPKLRVRRPDSYIRTARLATGLRTPADRGHSRTKSSARCGLCAGNIGVSSGDYPFSPLFEPLRVRRGRRFKLPFELSVRVSSEDSR